MIARYSSLAVLLLLVILAAAGGAVFEAGEWYYHALTKPSWSPPPWLIAVAWAVAYLFAALAAWNVWLTGHYDRLKALAMWLALLVLNVTWSFAYFGLHRPGWSWLTLGVTVIVAVLCIRAFRPLSRQAAGLMIPYLLWIAFLWLLNLSTWTLSGGILSRLSV